ncbi:MAG TPA: hypothetical protein VEU62_01590 [Bryobacterales bacterium]|nr:hypothetical protein [Bryobacterales bacterium]
MTDPFGYVVQPQEPVPVERPEIQRIAVKILTNAPQSLNLDPVLSIFARWRKDESHPAQWVDLADYAHMSRGLGIVLVGRLCNFAFDMGLPAPGILYTSKKGLEGETEDRLRHVLRASLEMTRALLAEPEFPAGVHLDTGALELAFNDRLETPNIASTDRLLRPAVLAVLDQVFGSGGYEAAPERDPARRYGFSVRAVNPPPLEGLLARLPS